MFDQNKISVFPYPSHFEDFNSRSAMVKLQLVAYLPTVSSKPANNSTCYNSVCGHQWGL